MILKEQLIESNSEEAISYRNIHRPKVDKLFIIKLKSKGVKRKKFDELARQMWRKIIQHSNTL